MLARWLPLIGLFAIGSFVACAPPALPSGADQNAAESKGGNGGTSSTSSASSGDDDDSAGKKSGDDDDDSTTGDDDDSTAGAGNKKAAGGGGGGGGSEPQTFDAVFTALKPTCGGCHAVGPGPQFFGTDAPSSYPLFKTEGASNIEAKGKHEGDPLTADQKSAVDAWIAADPNAG